MKDLMDKVASEAQDKWNLIGIELGIKQNVLNGIARQEHERPLECYTEMFDRWERNNNPRAPFLWSTILKALRSPTVKENNLAGIIEQWLSDKR